MSKFLIFLFILSACTVGEDYHRPQIYSDEVIKNELGLNRQYKLPQKWYAELGDEQLVALIDKAFDKSPDVETAVARLKQARAQLGIDRTARLPFINLSGGWNYDKGSRNVKFATDSHYYNAGFDASWEIDLWGKNLRQIQADKANIEALSYSLSDVKITLAAEIASNYAYLMQNRELLKTARENEVLQKQIFAGVEAKYNTGLVDDIAYNQAKYLLVQTQAEIPMYESNIESYHNALAVLVGILPSEIITSQNSPLFRRSYTINKKLVYGIPAGAVRLRPDVAAKERKLASQSELIGKAVAELYPDVSISGFWGYASQGGHGLISSASQNYNYSPALSMPLLDWNKLSNNIELQKQIYVEDLANYKKSLINAVAEIKSAGVAWEKAGQTYVKQVEAGAKMQQVVDAVQKRYDKGLVTFSELLTMRQNLIKSQKQIISAKTEELQQMIAFYKAVGI